uniref:Uncharacterized protein n=1 Tax=Candidatus Kentrum sp. LFY TaxID=2126342 RepID=A0A450UFW1_9GAMM|nr:MAG: hypothetical protein BECKLFY1418A_GA0070994_101610 [Candidatus Kentron sp. LFY]
MDGSFLPRNAIWRPLQGLRMLCIAIPNTTDGLLVVLLLGLPRSRKERVLRIHISVVENPDPSKKDDQWDNKHKLPTFITKGKIVKQFSPSLIYPIYPHQVGS